MAVYPRKRARTALKLRQNAFQNIPVISFFDEKKCFSPKKNGKKKTFVKKKSSKKNFWPKKNFRLKIFLGIEQHILSKKKFFQVKKYSGGILPWCSGQYCTFIARSSRAIKLISQNMPVLFKHEILENIFCHMINIYI